MENGKEKIAVSYSNYTDFVTNLRNKYDNEFKLLSAKLERQYTSELQDWFAGHVITDSES